MPLLRKLGCQGIVFSSRLVEIKDDDTAEKLQWKDYDKINVSRKQVRTQQKTEISRFEEQLQKLKETTREDKEEERSGGGNKKQRTETEG